MWKACCIGFGLAATAVFSVLALGLKALLYEDKPETFGCYTVGVNTGAFVVDAFPDGEGALKAWLGEKELPP